MGIKVFASMHNVPVSTVRYYIDVGLLIPKKKNGIWIFDDEDSLTMRDILNFKNCGFTLERIESLLNIRYNSNNTRRVQAHKMRKILLEECERLYVEKKQTAHSILLLKHEYSDIVASNVKISIPLHLFSLIACPYCNLALTWESTIISANSVLSGTGRCYCGYSAIISDGILFAQGNEIIIETIDTDFETTKRTSARDISLMEKDFFWMFERLNSEDLEEKIIFEDVINVLCFTAKALPLLKSSPDFILVDSCPEVIQHYAEFLPAIRPDCNFMMIVDDGVHHPIKKNCIDIVIDYCSSEIIQQYGYFSVFSILSDYMKNKAKTIGRFSYLQKIKLFSENKMSANRVRYDLQALHENMYQNGIIIDDDSSGEDNLDLQIYARSVPGDIIRSYVFSGHLAIDSIMP